MINTLVLTIEGNQQDQDKIQQAAQVLKEGGTVAFPTETVYGLGANGLDPKAVKKIYEAKGRPSDNPLILHIADKEEIKPLVASIPPVAEKLIEAFWPGPLTIIFEKSSIIPKEVTGGLNTVALRMPSHPIAHWLIKETRLPIAAPSANLSGKPSPTKAEHVIQDLTGRVDIIIEGDPSQIGLESTVVDITTPIPTILRPGGITYEDLQNLLGEVNIDPGILDDLGQQYQPKSPGMKYTHYAPAAPMTMIEGPTKAVVEKINALTKEYQLQGKKVGILATVETKDDYRGDIVLSLGQRDKPQSIASNLFDLLRQFDKEKVDVILAESISSQGIGFAIINRMTKAAGHRIIHVAK